MRLTTRGEYALLALVYLARHVDEGYVTIETIATVQEIPHKFLEQIARILKRSHYLSSLKGQHGGYKLARPAKEITLAASIRLMDGPLAPSDSVSLNFYRSTPIEKEDKLVKVLSDIRDKILEIMEHTTLADIS